MRIIGLKDLTWQQIDEEAIKMLKYVDPDHFSYPKCTDLKKITTYLTEKHGYIFDFKCTVGFAPDGGKIIGAFHPEKRVIVIDQSIVTDEFKFNFTLAHEIGHLALHRKLEFPDRNTPLSNINRRKPGEYTDVDRMERQANKYAAGLLVPAEMLTKKIARQQGRLGIKADGRINIDNHSESRVNAEKIIIELCKFFGVSRSCINMRLYDLQLTNDFSTQPRTAYEIASYFINDLIE